MDKEKGYSISVMIQEIAGSLNSSLTITISGLPNKDDISEKEQVLALLKEQVFALLAGKKNPAGTGT